MLLIWDIHINARFQDTIIDHLQKYIGQHPQESTIIFTGDYVYHFSYDRTALLALYHLFLELISQGKIVYILAGNHDRLGSSFVFEEAKKAFDIVNTIDHAQGKIFFITQAQFTQIEGQEVLFLPYTIQVGQLGAIETKPLPMHIQGTIELLKQSKNKNEQLSAYVNEYLRSAIADKQDLLIIHHYYINHTKFPGQKSLFSYKDVALHEAILQQPNIKSISWHLHQSFTQNNYVCLGSVRSTTPLEVNQNKYLFAYHPQTKTLEASEIGINPYLSLTQGEGIINQEAIQAHRAEMSANNRKNLSSPLRNITIQDAPIELAKTSLAIKTESIDYQDIDSYITPELRQQIKDIKLKKESVELNELLENFEISAKNLSTGFADRKDILKSYIQKKHPDNYEMYITKLKEFNLL